MDVIYIFKVLYRRIWLILTIPLLAGVLAYLFTLDMKKKYKSSAQLATGFTTRDKVQLTKENFDYWESKANFENLEETMKSDLIGSMVSYGLLLHDLEVQVPFRERDIQKPILYKDSIAAKLRKNIKTFELLSSYDPFESQILEIIKEQGYDFAKWLKDGNISIGRIGDTDFIKVEFLSENPMLSAYVVNDLCEAYMRYNNNVKTATTEESLEFFASEVEKKKTELDAKTELLNNYKSDNQVYNYDKESNTRLSQLTEYEIKLQEEENQANAISISLKTIKAKIANYENVKSSSENGKLLELRNKISELNKIYVDGGSKDAELASTIATFRSQLQDEMSRLDLDPDDKKRPKTKEELIAEREELELEWEITNSNLNTMRDKVNSLKSNVSRIGTKESAIASMERERDNAFKDYSTAVERYNEAKSKSLISSNGVKLMIKGQPAPKPESSKTLIIVALAVFGSGALCIGVLIMMEFFDYRIKTPDKFLSFTKLKLLGYINDIDMRKMEPGYKPKNKAEQQEVETVKDSLRKIRFNIENTNSRVILVSSPQVQDGKTFVIVSLAKTLSLMNKKILIIDTNFKNTTLTQQLVAKPLLQAHSELKLLQAGPVTDDENYSASIISFTNDKNIDIIGSSSGSESPSEIFAGRDFKSMINSLRSVYDYIFLEGASLNEFSDSRELVEYADGLISVFSAKTTLKAVDRESIQYLKMLNGKFLGAILNGVDKKDLA